MKKTFPELPGWIFDIGEVSAGVYEVMGRDKNGRVVSGKGIDVYDLINKCKAEASKLSKEP
jgi:hypothetical protein